MNLLIFVHGAARSGKDTFFEYIKELYLEKGVECKRFSFADKLKEEFSSLFKIPLIKLHNEEKEIYRSDLISFAENCRMIDNNVWIYDVYDQLLNYQTKQKYIEKDYITYKTKKVAVITDFRNENEYNYLKENLKDYDILTVRINRNVIGARSDYYLKNFKFNYIIDNYFDLKTYQNKIKEIYRSLDV